MNRCKAELREKRSDEAATVCLMVMLTALVIETYAVTPGTIVFWAVVFGALALGFNWQAHRWLKRHPAPDEHKPELRLTALATLLEPHIQHPAYIKGKKVATVEDVIEIGRIYAAGRISEAERMAAQLIWLPTQAEEIDEITRWADRELEKMR